MLSTLDIACRFIPRPLWDLVSCGGDLDRRLVEARRAVLGATVVRIALAILGSLAICKLGTSLGVSAVIGITAGTLVSLPSFLIAGGSWLLYHGAIATIAAVKSGSFVAFGVGFSSMVGGAFFLENYTTPVVYFKKLQIIEQLLGFPSTAGGSKVGRSRFFHG